MVRAKTVADFDEVLLGSVYVPSNATTTTLINRESCSWFNIMDDDISSVRSEQASGDGSWTARNKYYDLHAMTYGYYTWQQDVTENLMVAKDLQIIQRGTICMHASIIPM